MRAQPHRDPLVGREVVGQYVIERKLGEGAMGSVYLADQRSLGRKVAIKVLKREVFDRPGLAARFQLEARAASKLEHRNIAAVHGFGTLHDGTPFLATEYVPGRDVARMIASDGPFDPGRAHEIVSQVVAALVEGNRRGMPHGQLKSPDVIVPDDSLAPVKVVDFGFARLHGGRVDSEGDVRAVGVLMFHMLTGSQPPPAAEDPPPSLRRLNAGVPVAVDLFVQRLLSRNAGDRPGLEALGRELDAAFAAPQAQAPRGPQPARPARTADGPEAERSPAESSLLTDVHVPPAPPSRPVIPLPAPPAIVVSRWDRALRASRAGLGAMARGFGRAFAFLRGRSGAPGSSGKRR